MAKEKIVLIDGSGYIFRAFFAVQRLSTSKGMPTNAVFGFCNMLSRVLEIEKPTKLAIVFDTPKPTFRKELFPDYKINRSLPPDDLVPQFPYIHRAVDAFGVKRMVREGFEADDVIGTIAKRAKAEGYAVEIITGDKDLMQLVDDQVQLYDTMKDRRIDANGVKERFGVMPEQVVDFLALMGDSSDNIPGVNGIGEKTAAELLNQFGTLDGIYERLGEIKSEKRRATLLGEKDDAYLSQRLARIHTDVPLEFTWADFNYRGPVTQSLRELFQELEFNVLLKRFNLQEAAPELPEGDYRILRDEKSLAAAIAELSKAATVAIDTETTSLHPHDAELVGISLSAKGGTAYYVPVGHRVQGSDQLLEGQVSKDVAKRLMRPFLESSEIRKVGQNLKYDYQVFKRWGVDLQGIVADTLLESYLIEPEQSHGLDALALRYLNRKNLSYDEVTRRGKQQLNFSEVDIELAAKYSGEDADVALQIHEILSPKLTSSGMEKLYREIELPLVPILAEMEYCGVLVDKERLLTMEKELTEEMGSVQERIHALAGEPVNVNSPKQLSKILFEKLKLPVIRKTKTGISTDESVLTALCKDHEICQWILKFRELGKLKSTYVEGLLGQIHPETKRVHTNYNQTVAATGRLSSSNPNLQNIPAFGEKYDVRSVFVAPAGSVLLSADYSQIELRLLAAMSGDKELSRAFHNEEDIHSYTGKLIFGTADISAEQRRIAKTINFGVVYGQTPFGLSQTLGISPSEAKAFIEAYFQRYSGVKGFMERVLKETRERGYVSTLLGRRRYFGEINSQNRMRREMAERAAINAPLQGTAADLVKIAMVALSAQLKREKMKSRLILQVHDELVLEVPTLELKEAERLTKEAMESALKLEIPLRVEIGSGNTWRDCD